MSSLFNDKLLIHVDEVDDQHRELFQAVDKFQQACMNKKGNEEIKVLFDFLKNYTIEHFELEEKYMIKCNYPRYNAHKKIHSDFIENVLSLEETVKDDQVPLTTLIKVNRFLTDWLIVHVSKEDKLLGQFLADKL